MTHLAARRGGAGALGDQFEVARAAAAGQDKTAREEAKIRSLSGSWLTLVTRNSKKENEKAQSR